MQLCKGTRFECELPAGYDERTDWVVFNGMLVVCHPDFPPCWKNEGGKLVPISPQIPISPDGGLILRL